MSEVQDAPTYEREQPAEPVPMPMADAPAPAEPETFSSDTPGITAAANELSQRRQQDTPIITREYQDVKTNEKRPLHETRTLSQAADDLKNVRAVEDAAFETATADRLAQQVDRFRTDAAAAERGQQTPQQQQPAPPEAAPADLFRPQPESPEVPGGDPELVKLFQNEKIRGGITHALNQAEAARQQYAQAAQQALQQAAISSFAAVPELHGCANLDQVRGALAVIQKNNPQRFLEINGHLQKIEQVRQFAHQQQQAQQAAVQQQQQQAAQQFSAYSKAADAEYDKFQATRPAEEVKQVREAVLDTLEEQYGLSKQAVAELYTTSPVFRSAGVQRALYDLTRLHLLQQNIHRAPMPNRLVMRPGTVETAGIDYTGFAEKMREFAADPNPRKAAAALIARRAASRR